VADFDFDGLRAYLTNHDLQVVVGSRLAPGEPWRARRLGARGELQEAIRTITLRNIDRLETREEAVYIEGWTPDPETYAIVPAEDTGGPLRDAMSGAYSARMERDEAPGAVAGEADDEPLPSRVLGLVGRADNHELLIVRARGPIIEMSRDRITAVVRGSQLSEARRLFAYDGRIDVLIWDRHAVVLAANVFEDLMRDPARLRRELDEAVAAFEATNLVADVQQLAATASLDSNFARGIRRIHKSGHLAAVGLDAVRRQIETWGHDTIGIADDRRIRFDPVARWEFLRLLDDGYLTSDLTGFRYEVNSKRRWNRVEVLAVHKDGRGEIASLHGVGNWSPRSAADAAADIDRDRTRYFIKAPAGIVPVRTILRPRGLVPWAGPDLAHNLLLDLPEPDG
jgi:hypothetical protein